MDFADALAADELWGWPAAVLDQLRELHELAHNGEISLEEWRERDAACRAGLPDIDIDEVRRFETSWMKHSVLDASGVASTEAGERLTGRLTALLNPAPTDEKLWEVLASVSKALAEAKRDRRYDQTRRGMRDIYRRERDRIAGWLTRPGSGIDPVTGLPWSRIAGYRVIDDPGLGPVPQYVEAARRLAEPDAPAEERQRAEMVRDHGDGQPMAAAAAKVYEDRLTWLPRLLLDAAEHDDQVRPLQADLARIWADPRVQRLLLRETSRGWPPDIDPSRDTTGT